MITFSIDTLPTITRDEAVSFYCYGTRDQFKEEGLYEITVIERNEVESVEYLPGVTAVGFDSIDEIFADKDRSKGRTRAEIEEMYVAKYDADLGGAVLSAEEEGYTLIVNVI